MDRLKFTDGIYKIAKLPEDWTEDMFRYWWCDELDSEGRTVRHARMSQREKERYYVAEYHNMLLNGGVTQIINYLINSIANTPVLAQYLAIGNGSINKVLANDTSLSGEFFRKAPTGATNVGTQSTISTALLSTDATGQWSNIGVFGNNATATLGSGILMSQALTTFNKPSSPYTVDWILQLFSN